MPLDAMGYNVNFHEIKNLVYTVNVAPENVLNGPLSDYEAYIESLKKKGFKNDFDYVFNFAFEKRNRYLERNAKLITLKLSPRIINRLDEMEIHGIKKLKETTIKELCGVKGIGEQTVSETLAILKAAGITLQEETVCENVSV
jgi:DNA-directed RNA polymerase alpha subunit